MLFTIYFLWKRLKFPRLRPFFCFFMAS